MYTTRLISTLAAAIAALAVAAPAAAQEPPSDLTLEEASARFSAGSSVQATGGGVVKNATRMQFEGGGGGVCWGAELLRSKGTWPYTRRLYLYTVWCGAGGAITYRSSSVRTSHDPICWNTSGPHVAKTAGGAYFSFVEVQAWTAVACHSPIYFVSFHDSLMMRVRYYPNGVYHTVAYD